MENTNKHTKIQKLFKNDFFQIYFFVFLVLFFLDNYQILFSSIECVFLTFDLEHSVFIEKQDIHALSFIFRLTNPLTLFLAEKLLNPNDTNIYAGLGVFVFVLPIIFIAIFLLVMSSVIIMFKQIKNFIFFKTKFNIFFYILLSICIYSVCMIVAINTTFTPFGHMFMIKDFNIEKMKICIIIAFCTTLAFKFLIHFTLKDKK